MTFLAARCRLPRKSPFLAICLTFWLAICLTFSLANIAKSGHVTYNMLMLDHQNLLKPHIRKKIENNTHCHCISILENISQF